MRLGRAGKQAVHIGDGAHAPNRKAGRKRGTHEPRQSQLRRNSPWQAVKFPRRSEVTYTRALVFAVCWLEVFDVQFDSGGQGVLLATMSKQTQTPKSRQNKCQLRCRLSLLSF